MYLINCTDVKDSVYKKSKPIFSSDNFSYRRNEKHGYISGHSTKLPILNEIFINPTANEFLKLCNGERTPKEISLEAYKIFKGASLDQIENDLKEVLFLYSRYALINWEEGVNPFMKEYTKVLENNFTLSLANESELVEIIEFIKKDNNDKGIFYLSSTKRVEDYTDELVLRQKIFMYSEEFVLVKDIDNKIVGILTVLIPANMRSTCGSIGLVKMPNDFVSISIDYIMNIIKEISVKDLSKVKYHHVVGNSNHESLKNSFIQNKFMSEGVLKNEYENMDIEVLSYIF